MLSVNQFIGSNAGGYQIERLLGQSQLGAAYLARQSEQGYQATVTTFNLPEDISSQEYEQLSQRFLKEGEALVRMAHPHILPIHAFGIQPGYVYLITTFAKEASLAQFLKKNDRFTPQQILPILKQLAQGLDYAHDQGIVHGMLSLANVIMSDELTVRIAGFGLRTILEIYGNPKSAAPMAHLSNERNLFLLGNAEYISPERVVGLPIDARTDIYSLGVMLFVLLSGTHPFRGVHPLDVALQRLQQPVPLLRTIHPDISEAFDLVIGQAMERDPAKRPQRASDIAVLFERVIQSQNPAWGLNGTAASQLQSDSQTTLPPTVNWFDEQVMPSGQWEMTPPAVFEQLTNTPLGVVRESTDLPSATSFSSGNAPDSLGGTDPFAWWATTSTSQPKAQPLPGTFPWSTPIRKTNAKLPARQHPGQLDRRKLVTVIVTGAVVAGVTVTGISFARLLQSTQRTSSQIASGSTTGASTTGSTGQTTTTGNNTPTTGATQGAQQPKGTSTPSAAGTPKPTATKSAPGAPTTQPTPGSQPTPTPKPQPTPTPPPSHTGTVIGHTTQGNNSSITFSNPADGQSSLLIRLANGSFVACERACTHARVPVDYDWGSQQIVCPAHGAIFNPQSGFAHTSGPGGGSLPTVSIRVNADGTITTG